MVKINRLISFVLVLVVWFYGITNAKLIVNEVMSNEPGSNTTLEWIELLNTNVADSFSLGSYKIDADGTTLSFQFRPEAVRGDSFIIICQNRSSFESYWGNNSGIWGDDTTAENYQLIEFTDDFSLANNDGTVSLYNYTSKISFLSWLNSGSDGVSWERFSPDSTEVYQSDDPTGSTPGYTNSRTPLPYDLALRSVNAIRTDSGETELKFVIANIGLEVVVEDSLFLYIDPERDTIVSQSDLLAKTQIPDIEPGDTLVIVLNFEFDAFYIDMLVQLLPDDRTNNSIQLFMAPGKDYPPIILSEFLADPTSSFKNEWIELKNHSDRDLDITDWYLGKNDVLYPIASTGYTMQRGEYLILCRDSLEFVDFYKFIDFTIIEPTGWPSLNNNGDMLKLIDNYGIVADSFAYDSTFGDNYTWGRGEVLGTNIWGRSTNQGGTPGAENIINYPASASDVKITVGQNPYSPGSAIEMTIEFVLPAGIFNMRLYDVEGRIVKTFFDNHYAYDGSIGWNGTSDGGRRLPVGMYILFAEVIGNGQYKQTIVIAP